MTQSDEEFGPSGSTEAHQVDVGEATEVDPQERARAARKETRPNLDARQRNISTTRRPMGPPRPRSDEERAESPVPEENNLEPTDPDVGER